MLLVGFSLADFLDIRHWTSGAIKIFLTVPAVLLITIENFNLHGISINGQR